jgi:hypothetical protein
MAVGCQWAVSRFGRRAAFTPLTRGAILSGVVLLEHSGKCGSDAADYPGPSGIYVHPVVGIFAVGSGKIKSGKIASKAWIVRRSTNGGANWQTVDTFQLSSGTASRALGISSDALGNLFVVGNGNFSSKGKSSSHWIVRKSVNAGASWSTVDDYQLVANNSAEAHCFVADSGGNLLVAGQAVNTTGSHWIVRQNPGGTGVWTTVDNVSNATAEAIAANESGNVFVGGASSAGWLVRKR